MAENTVASTEVTAEEVIPVFAKKKKRKWPRIVRRIILIVILLGALGAGGYYIYNLFKPQPTQMQTAWAYRGMLQNIVYGSGTATPADSADVVSLANGIIEEIYVNVGDRVTKGTPLFKVEASALAQKKAEAQKAYDEIIKKIDANNEKRNSLSVYTPIAGRLVNLSLKEGDYVTESTPIGMIIDDSNMRLVLQFSVRYLDMIKVGQRAVVSIPQSMASVEGTVTEIVNMNTVGEMGTLLFEVTIKLSNPGALTEGMLATATVYTETEPALPAGSGTLGYWERQVIFPKAAGTIAKMSAKNYYTYEKGAVLIELKNEEYNVIHEQLTKSLETAQGTMDEVDREYEYYSSVAPIDGTVLMINNSVGQKLSGTPTVVMSIANIDKMTIEAQIDELDVAKLEPGMAATVYIYTDRGTETFMGNLKSIALQGKVQSGYTYYPGVIEFSGSASLRSGMWVNFEIIASTKSDCIILPQKAVKYTEVGTVCLIRDPGERPENFVEIPNVTLPEGFIAVLVETGESDNYNIEIVSGISEGTEVATSEIVFNDGGWIGGPGGGGVIRVK